MGADFLITWYLESHNQSAERLYAQSVRFGICKSLNAGLLEEHMPHPTVSKGEKKGEDVGRGQVAPNGSLTSNTFGSALCQYVQPAHRHQSQNTSFLVARPHQTDMDIK